MSLTVADAVDYKGSPADKSKTGGWVPATLILGIEIVERLSTMGIAVNLVTYLGGAMHLASSNSANIVTDFMGTSFLLCLLGGFLADSFLGRYKTIALFALIQTLGTGMLTVATSLPQLRPSPCHRHDVNCQPANGFQMGILYLALYLIALGTGGLKSSVSGFGTDQFDEKDDKEKAQMAYFFNRFFFFISLGTLTAVTVLVYIQDEVGRIWAYGVCSVSMFIAIIIFLLGTKRYRYKKSAGSPIVHIFQVIVAAIRKRKMDLPYDAAMLYESTSTPEAMTIQHTQEFRILDKAAIVTEGDFEEHASCSAPNPWKLSSVTRVEEVKMMARLLPIWATTIIFWPEPKPKSPTISGSSVCFPLSTQLSILNSQFSTPMATSSSCSSPYTNGSSPITTIAQDHLFSILLLLPLDSIFCFALTCKKFRSLTYSDSLWESLCRRDWGNSTIDALRSFDVDGKQQQFPWKKLYQQIYQLDSVYCRRLLTHPQGGEELLLPRPRASHSLNFVSGCLVLFGGGCEGGRHLDDTWVAYAGNDFKRILEWNKIESGVPSGRFGHSCVVIGDCLVLFGGINDHGARQNDTWIGQVAVHDAFGITLSWRLLDVGSIVPPPRGAHAACSMDKRRMLIHGGIGLSGLRLGDTWVLELSENLHLGVWQEIVTHPSPPSRSGHTLTPVGGNQTILFGGRGLGYEVLNDVWLFDTSDGHWRWVQLLFDLQNIPQGLTLPRVGHSANLIIGGRLLIYGGEDSYRHRKNDFWVLDISSVTSIMQSGSPPSPDRSMTKLWRRLKSKGDNPCGRSFHRACVDPSGRNLYIFGGMVDGLLNPAESSGLRFDGELFLVELLLQC